jgi:2-oxoglutarate ferredoxin oxidoreductase subunit gamma
MSRRSPGPDCGGANGRRAQGRETMEHEIMITGVGGQGIQLAAQVLARAATLEGRQVMYLGTYGGTMRGGNTDSTMVIADTPILTPPILAHVGSAIAMHHAFWGPVEKKLRPGALVFLNSTVFEAKVSADDPRIVEVPATRIADDQGNPLGASMVLIAAYARHTGIVALDSLVEAMEQSIPSYRQQHIESNGSALRSGFDALAPDEHGAWRAGGNT